MNTVKDNENLETLLPWYVVGTLTREDAARLEEALASDRELCRRLELAREERSETCLLSESLGAPSARNVEAFFAALSAAPANRATVSFNLAGRLADFIAGISHKFSHRTLALGCCVAALAIVLHAGAVMTSLLKMQGGSELASAAVNDASLAVIRFAAKADVADINAFLAAHAAAVVDGPKFGGIYTIRLPATGPAKDALIATMQAHTAIVEFITTVE